ncbi:unnamed protein product [Dibothriocephalus latus]|uniref:Uncharacterized protein n=1 Tax=Dibothriocephalus latus TaxID=60516 RepID=A0A3P6TQF5_DIBLA|nr:unnamed protein product [Dibothriocephalus latus]
MRHVAPPSALSVQKRNNFRTVFGRRKDTQPYSRHQYAAAHRSHSPPALAGSTALNFGEDQSSPPECSPCGISAARCHPITERVESSRWSQYRCPVCDKLFPRELAHVYSLAPDANDLRMDGGGHEKTTKYPAEVGQAITAKRRDNRKCESIDTVGFGLILSWFIRS